MVLSELDIYKTNKTIGILSIAMGLSYIPYSIYLYLNYPYYHLNPNILYFYPPHQLTFFIVIWLYAAISILSGILIIKSSKYCYHFYNLLFLGLLFINGKRLLSVGIRLFDTGNFDNILRTIGNLIIIVISLLGIYYFSRKDIRILFKVPKKGRYVRYILYILITLTIYVIPKFII